MGVAELAAKITLDAKQYESVSRRVIAMAKKTEQSFEKLKEKSANIGANFAGMKDNILNSLGAISSGITGIFAAGAAAATGFFAMIVKKSNDAAAIVRDATRVGVDTTTLQQWTLAGQKMGLEADKIADVFKDVNDKIGDFILTGGGEAKDIFEKLSLDAREFIGLSPDQALLKISAAAEKLTLQDKIFLFESLADDASALLPILEKNGAELEKLKKQAIEKGLILSPAELESLNAFNAGLKEITDRIKGFASHVSAYLSAPLQVVLGEVEKLITSFGGMDNAAMGFAEYFIEKLSQFIVWAAGAWDKFKLGILETRAIMFSLADGILMIGQAIDNLPFIEIDVAGLQKQRDNIQSMLDDISKEKLELEAQVKLNTSDAQKFANDLKERMKSALGNQKTALEVAQKSGYAANLGKANTTASKEMYDKRVAEEAKKEAEKQKAAAEKAAEKQKAASEKQQLAADKLLSAAEKQQLTAEQQAAQIAAQSAYAVAERKRLAELEFAKQKNASERLKQEQAQLQAQIALENSAKSVAEFHVKFAETIRQQAQEMKESVQATQQAKALTPPTTTQIIDVKVNGNIMVDLNGANDTVAKAVTAHPSFKIGVSELIKPELTKLLQRAATSVGSPLVA